MYKIKQFPEDFIVDEQFTLQTHSSGYYSYWLMKKRDLSTLSAVHAIAQDLKIPIKFIKYSVNKDKVAITSQLISIYKMPIEKIKTLNIKNISLEYLENFEEPIHLGMHQGNDFKIIVRNLDKEITPKQNIPNLFGSQRFSLNNVEIGRSIVKNDFEKAAKLVEESDFDVIRRHLLRHPMDYVGALRNLPLNLLRLYIHSYQSNIWNETVNRFLKYSPEAKQQSIPIIGFSTELGTSFVAGLIKEIMIEENITFRSFIIRQIPELSVEGGERMLYMDVSNLKISPLEEDELNQDKSKCTVQFTLGKGSYATVLIDFLCR